MQNFFIADGVIAADTSVFATLYKKDTASVLVISDTHEAQHAVQWIFSFMPVDACLFAGDGVPDILEAATELLKEPQSAKTQHTVPPVIFLARGNCDIGSYPIPQLSSAGGSIIIPAEQHITIAGLPILLTHGDTYEVRVDTARLRNAAKAARCTVAVYGHTHKQAYEQINGITCINGGSPRYPRNYSTAGFAHITIRKNARSTVDFYELRGSSSADFSAFVHSSYTI